LYVGHVGAQTRTGPLANIKGNDYRLVVAVHYNRRITCSDSHRIQRE
jgi:hypothetical protein